MNRKILFMLIILLVTSACEAVKPYQRVYVNDREMKMRQMGAKRSDENMQAYREGATGGGSKKNSGGCGCN